MSIIPHKVMLWSKYRGDVSKYRRVGRKSLPEELMRQGSLPCIGMQAENNPDTEEYFDVLFDQVGMKRNHESLESHAGCTIKCSDYENGCAFGKIVVGNNEGIAEARRCHCTNRDPKTLVSITEIKYESAESATNSMVSYLNDVCLCLPTMKKVSGEYGDIITPNTEMASGTLWYPSVTGGSTGQKLEIDIWRGHDNGWRIEYPLCKIPRLQRKICANCKFCNVIWGTDERVIYGLTSCRHHVCEKCVVDVYTWKPTNIDIMNRLLSNDQTTNKCKAICPFKGCRKELGDTLKTPFPGLEEMAAPKPCGYVCGKAVYDKEFLSYVQGVFVDKHFNELMLPIASQKAVTEALPGLKAYIWGRYPRGHQLKEKYNELVHHAGEVGGFIDGKEEVYNFLLGKENKWPRNFLEGNNAYYDNELTLVYFGEPWNLLEHAWAEYLIAVNAAVGEKPIEERAYTRKVLTAGIPVF